MAKGYVDPYGFSKPVHSSGGGGGSHSGYVDPYGFGKSAKPKAQKPQHHGGGGIGGFLGHIGHVVAQKASLAGHDIEGIPGGTYHLVKAALPSKEDIEHPLRFNSKSAKKQWGEFLTHPERSYKDTAKGKFGKDAQGAAQQFGGLLKGTEEAVRHPGRDPFQTLLVLSPALHVPLRAGEIARGTDIEAPRMLRAGGKEHALSPPSKSATGRAIQRAYDKAVQRGLDRNPEGRVARHANSRIGKQILESERPKQAMRATEADVLHHAGRKLSRDEQAALRLASENVTPEEARLFHEGQAAKGVNPKKNQDWATAYRRIEKNGLLRQDEHGNVVVDAEKHPRLAAVDELLHGAQRSGEKIIREHNLMSEQGARERLDAPGIQIRSAIHEPVGPTKGPFAGKTDSQLHARLDTLDKRYESLLDKLAAAEGRPGDYKRVTAYQNAVNKRLSRRGLGYDPVSKQLRDFAESKLFKFLDDHADVPIVKRVIAELDEASAIRKEISARNDAALGIGDHEETVPQELNRKRSVYGPQGRGFVTEKPLEVKAPKTGAARASSPIIGETRKPITGKARTGMGRELGEIPDNTTRLVAQNLRSLQRYVNTSELRKRWLETGSDTRRSSRDILVRVPGTKADTIPAHIEDLIGRKKLTYDELAGAHEGAREGLRAHLEDTIPGLRDKFAADRRARIGEKAPAGFKWVDRNVIGDYANSFSGSRGAIGRKFDNLISAITAATVYYKIGHIGTRVLTNAATNIIGGSAAPLQISRSFELFKKLSERDRRRAWAAAGQHGFQAMPHEGTGKLGAVATKGANFWAHRADAMFRFNAIAYEARKAGYSSPEQFTEFLNKLEHPEGLPARERARMENVAKRANRESIAYDRLSDAERRFIGRAFWFYPWVKGSVTYAGRTLTEHPFKSAALGAMGAQTRKQQEKTLGAIPSYEFGLLPIGRKDAHGNIPTTNLDTFSPFSTLGSLLQVPEYEEAAGNLNPGASALLSLLTRTDQYGQHSNAPVTDALQSLLAAAPEFQIAAAAHGHKSKMFPQTDTWQQVLRMLIGPAWRRKVNVPDLNRAAGLEKTGR